MIDDAGHRISDADRWQLAHGDVSAEVDDGLACWFLATCKPDCDGKAARWLVRRAFGIFQPLMKRKERYAGARADGSHVEMIVREPAFPGYIFVRTWNIERMAPRILNCPGVEAIMSIARGGADVPVAIPDDFITRLLGLDWVEDGSAAGRRVAVAGRRNRQRNPKRRPRRSNKIVSKGDRRASRLLTIELAEAGRLEPDERITAMLAAVRGALPVEGDTPPGNGG